jgi:hypothetical protein
MNLADLFATFQRDAWRLEARDVYNVPAEAAEIAEFERTGYVGPSPSWDRTVRAAAERGARIGRVRLVGHPITLYTQFEVAAYAHNITAGEDVRLVDRSWLDQSWDAAPDVWIFDGDAWVMRYDGTGAFLGVDQATNPSPYRQLRDHLTPIAVPLTQFQLTDATIPAPRTAPPAVFPVGLTG